jgi:hypothetical protein
VNLAQRASNTILRQQTNSAALGRLANRLGTQEEGERQEVYSQSGLLDRTALVAGAPTAILNTRRDFLCFINQSRHRVVLTHSRTLGYNPRNSTSPSPLSAETPLPEDAG